ncbi:MAG: hypothetical protein ACM34A_01840, partial [Bacillota bacterium]
IGCYLLKNLSCRHFRNSPTKRFVCQQQRNEIMKRFTACVKRFISSCSRAFVANRFFLQDFSGLQSTNKSFYSSAAKRRNYDHFSQSRQLLCRSS